MLHFHNNQTDTMYTVPSSKILSSSPSFFFLLLYPAYHLKGKISNENTAVISRLFIFFIAAAGFAVTDLCMTPKVIFLCIHSLKHQIFFQPCWSDLHKFIIIFPQHHQINIVIPGNISFMADSPDQSSAVSKIFKPIGFADTFYFIQHFQLHCPNTFRFSSTVYPQRISSL